MRPRPPLLVIVSGSPAAGKTTLATSLAKDLALPFFARDSLKELLMDAVGAPDRARSSELGRASFALLYEVVGRLLDASIGAVVESNFHRGRSEQDLEPLVKRANAILLHCETSLEEIERRYVERFARGERHEGHHDLDALPSLLTNLDQGVYEPLQLDIPTLRIDTTNGYSPTKRQIKTFLQQPHAALTESG